MFSFFFFFFFKQKTAYEMRISDWSSDVCSSDLLFEAVGYGDPDILPFFETDQRCRDRAVDRHRLAGPAADDERAAVDPERDLLAGQGRHVRLQPARRSEERRVGTDGVRKCRSRWSPYH